MRLFSSIVVCLVMLGPTNDSHAQKIEPPLTEPFEPGDLHTAWRLMGHEMVMFPLDLSAMPVLVGS